MNQKQLKGGSNLIPQERVGRIQTRTGASYTWAMEATGQVKFASQIMTITVATKISGHSGRGGGKKVGLRGKIMAQSFNSLAGIVGPHLAPFP